MIVLDTNILSEALEPSASDTVLRSRAAQEPSDVLTTTITQAEILYGVEALPPGKRRTRLHATIEKMFAEGRRLVISARAECAHEPLAGPGFRSSRRPA